MSNKTTLISIVVISFLFISSIAQAFYEGQCNKNAAEFIKRLKEEKDPKLRSIVAYCLIQAKAPEAVNPLIFALNDKYFLVRSGAAEALGELEDKKDRIHVFPPIMSEVEGPRAGMMSERPCQKNSDPLGFKDKPQPP